VSASHGKMSDHGPTITPQPERHEARNAVFLALQQWHQQGNPAAAVATLRPVAESSHDPVVVALVVWLASQLGQQQEHVHLLDEALATGIGTGAIATNYLSWAQAVPSERHRAPGLLRTALEAGWSIEPFSIAQQLAAQNDTETGWESLAQSTVESPKGARQQWTELLADVQASRGQIDGNVRVSEQARTAAVEAIEACERRIVEETERVGQLVQDATVLIQGAGAHQLANEYAARANTARRAATWWTLGTLVMGGLAIALGAAFVLVGVHQDHDPSDILTKAGISLPLLGVAAYLNKLAGEERRDARTWRHIELQIRTAQPYLANLPGDTRDNVQAALALRFFPGQSQNPHGGGADPEPDDAMALVRELQQHRNGGAGGGASG
jgi:hypothetical protein